MSATSGQLGNPGDPGFWYLGVFVPRSQMMWSSPLRCNDSRPQFERFRVFGPQRVCAPRGYCAPTRATVFCPDLRHIRLEDLCSSYELKHVHNAYACVYIYIYIYVPHTFRVYLASFLYIQYKMLS